MKKLYILTVLIASIIFTSCKKESLQTYLVESKEKSSFVTLDFSTSVLPIELDKATPEEKKAFESIRKVNLAFLPTRKATKVELNAEKEKLQAILKNSDYKVLMKLNDKKGMATIFYKGKVEAINEIIAFGHSNEIGVGVARLLGDKMNPNAILKMMKKADIKQDSEELSRIQKIFKNQASKI